MTAQNLISRTFTEVQATALAQKLAAMKEELPFLVSLQKDETPRLLKAGNAYAPFIEKVSAVVEQHREILPPVFDIEEFQRDCALAENLAPVARGVKELAEALERTLLAANSDALTAGLEVYAAVKQNKDRVPGLAVAAEEMAAFFRKTKKTVQTETK